MYICSQFYGERGLFYNLDWPGIFYEAQSGLTPMLLLPSPKCQKWWQALLHHANPRFSLVTYLHFKIYAGLNAYIFDNKVPIIQKQCFFYFSFLTLKLMVSSYIYVRSHSEPLGCSKKNRAELRLPSNLWQLSCLSFPSAELQL